MPVEKQAFIGLDLQPIAPVITPTALSLNPASVNVGLIEVPVPEKSDGFGERTPKFRANKAADYSLRDEKDRKLGAAGEAVVLKQEVERLALAGRSDLAAKVSHVSKIEGDGAGYDIKSFNIDGSVKYIEVKTTRGGMSTPFFMSINEILFSKTHANNFAIYRIFDFDVDALSGKVFVLAGNIECGAHLEAINFRVKL